MTDSIDISGLDLAPLLVFWVNTIDLFFMAVVSAVPSLPGTPETATGPAGEAPVLDFPVGDLTDGAGEVGSIGSPPSAAIGSFGITAGAVLGSTELSPLEP